MFLLDVPKCKSIPEITCQNEVELYFFSFFPFWLSWRFLMAAKKKWPPKKMAAKKKWPPKIWPNDVFICFNYFDEASIQTHYMNNTKVILKYVPCSWVCIIFGFLAIFKIFFKIWWQRKVTQTPPPIFLDKNITKCAFFNQYIKTCVHKLKMMLQCCFYKKLRVIFLFFFENSSTQKWSFWGGSILGLFYEIFIFWQKY